VLAVLTQVLFEVIERRLLPPGRGRNAPA